MLLLLTVLLYSRGRRQPTARRPDEACQGGLPGPQPFTLFNDRYAAINRRNDSHLFLLVFAIFGGKKTGISGKNLVLVFANRCVQEQA